MSTGVDWRDRRFIWNLYNGQSVDGGIGEGQSVIQLEEE